MASELDLLRIAVRRLIRERDLLHHALMHFVNAESEWLREKRLDAVKFHDPVAQAYAEAVDALEQLSFDQMAAPQDKQRSSADEGLEHPGPAGAPPTRDEVDALAAQLETCKAAHMSNCLDADKLRAQKMELREALESILAAADNSPGIWTPMIEPFKIARAALAKGRA